MNGKECSSLAGFLEQRALIEDVLASDKSVPALDASLRQRGTTLRCIAREIPVVFGQWFVPAKPLATAAGSSFTTVARA